MAKIENKHWGRLRLSCLSNLIEKVNNIFLFLNALRLKVGEMRNYLQGILLSTSLFKSVLQVISNEALKRDQCFEK